MAEETNGSFKGVSISNILTGLIISAIMFAGTTFLNQSKDSAAVATSLAALTATVAEIRTDLKTVMATAVQKSEFKDLEVRVHNLELKRIGK